MPSSFNNTDKLISDALRRKGASFLTALMTRMNFLMVRFQQKVQREKLSGQVLNQRSGKLINSVRVIAAAVKGSSVEASVEAAGGPAWYGKVHEFGGTRSYLIEAVNAKSLAFQTVGGMVFRRSVVHPPLPRRSFMGSTAQEMAQEIRQGLQDVVNEAGQ